MPDFREFLAPDSGRRYLRLETGEWYGLMDLADSDRLETLFLEGEMAGIPTGAELAEAAETARLEDARKVDRDRIRLESFRSRYVR